MYDPYAGIEEETVEVLKFQDSAHIKLALKVLYLLPPLNIYMPPLTVHVYTIRDSNECRVTSKAASPGDSDCHAVLPSCSGTGAHV